MSSFNTKLDKETKAFIAAIEASAALKKKAEEEAWNREYFIDHIADGLIGGKGEFYLSRLSEKNGEMKNVAGWMKEARRIAQYELRKRLLHERKGFKDMDKAWAEIVRGVFINEEMSRNMVHNLFIKYYPNNPRKYPLDDSDSKAYLDMINETYQTSKVINFKSDSKIEEIKSKGRRGRK